MAQAIMQRINGDYAVAAQFAAVLSVLDEAKVELRAGSLVGAMEKVAVAAIVLDGTLGELERVDGVPWTAIMVQPGYQP